jgi:hypothetical protein
MRSRLQLRYRGIASPGVNLGINLAKIREQFSSQGISCQTNSTCPPKLCATFARFMSDFLYQRCELAPKAVGPPVGPPGQMQRPLGIDAREPSNGEN